MRTALRRIRGAIGMGLTWALGWAVVGLLIGVSSVLLPFLPWDAFFEIFDAPLPALGLPGFIGGALFSVVLGTAARRHRFRDLSLLRFTAWGALGGLLLSLVPATMSAVGLATLRDDLNVWSLTATIAPPLILLSAASAAASLLVARRAEERGTPGDDAADETLGDSEAPARLGDGGGFPSGLADARTREPVRRDAGGSRDA